MKYAVLWWARHYFKDMEQAIELGGGQAEPVHKGLQSGYNNDDAGEAVVLVSNMVRDLIQIKKGRTTWHQQQRARTRERDLFVYAGNSFSFSVTVS
jgi:hypothetical protein